VSLAIDSLLRDRYRIKALIAKSGMGTIYLAHDEVLNVDIAIKENLYTTETHSRQFRQEATILAKLRHPNLPRVIDHFVIEGMGEYLVMDFVSGQDLSQHLESLGNPMPEEEVVRIGAVICEALNYLHSRTPPIIHRDIKPANLKLTPEGHIVLVDFGLAKFYEQGEMTSTGAQGITAGYSPPEQYGQGTDTRSDIYALGAMLYTLLTDHIPPEALERAIGEDSLQPISKFNSTVSPAVAGVITKAMAIKAEGRYQTIREFQEALLAAHPLPDFSPSKPVVAPIGGDTAPKQTPIPHQQPKKKRSLWTWLIPVLIIITAGTAAAIFLLGNNGPSHSKTPSSSTATPNVVNVIDEPTENQTDPPATETEPAILPSATIAATSIPQGTPQGGGQGQIAFVSERSGLPQIFLMNADGSNVSQLTSETQGACQPEWSPNGNRLAYISPCGGLQERYDGASIFILNLNNGRTDLISTLATGDYDPAWSPDGDHLAFTSLQTGKPQIFIYEFDNDTSHILMNRSTVNRMPAWSPDGEQIVFVSPSPVNNQPILFIVDSSGQNEPRAVTAQANGRMLRPTWSPEGNLIRFDLGNGGVLGGHLLLGNQDVPLDTSLSLAENPSFSPDANWIVFNGVQSGSGLNIYLIPHNDVQLTALTDDLTDNYQPAWRP
jgi:eukaryotic-like serine/threonine-protein kinase